MSIISRNQITIINVNDGEPGPAGPQGDPGQDGSDGQSLYTWTAYADDKQGNGISLNPTGKPYIGFAYNRSSSSVDLTNPGVFTWAPFYTNLIAEQVQIIDGGALKSHNYQPGSAGFFIDSDGSAEFENGTFRGTIDNDLLTTREASDPQSPVSFSPKTHWWAQDLYDAVRAHSGSSHVNANITYKGTSYGKIAALEYGEQVQITDTLSAYDIFRQTITETDVGTVPISGTYRMTLWASLEGHDEPNDGQLDNAFVSGKVYEDGSLIAEEFWSARDRDTNGTKTVDFSLSAGKSYTLEFEMVCEERNGGSASVKMEAIAPHKGVFCLNDADSFAIQASQFLPQLSNSFSISSPISWASSSHDDYAAGDGFIDGLPSSVVTGGIYNATGSLSYNGSHSISAVMKASSTKIVVYTDGGNFEFEKGKYYIASGSYELQLQAEAVLTKSLIPKDTESYDLGTAAERFRNLYIQGIQTDTMNLAGSEMFACRAWVNFYGPNCSIRADGNVSSITDRGTGLYKINFENPMIDADYAAVAMSRGVDGSEDSQENVAFTNRYTPNQNAFEIGNAYNGSQKLFDTALMSVAVFR